MIAPLVERGPRGRRAHHARTVRHARLLQAIIRPASGRWQRFAGHAPVADRRLVLARQGREGELPIDDSDGGCDCQPQCKQGSPWTRQHPAIEIADADFISDNGKQVYSYFVEQGIKNVIYMGVHTNMCVLGRSFGIRQMTRLGMNACWCAT